MTALADVRPAGLDLLFRPGTTVTLTTRWPDGELAGRALSADLDGAPLEVSVAGDTATIVAPASTTGGLELGRPVEWRLLEQVDGALEPLIVGTWTPSDDPRAVEGATVEVVVGEATVVVEVASAQAAVTELARAFEAHTEAGLGDDVHGVIAHDWDRDGWGPFQPVVITAHGSQQFNLEADDARGVVTGPGPEGSHRVALLRQGTLWRDAEVRSVVWGPLGAWTGANAQQGHLHRVRQIGPNLWEGIAVWTSVVFGQDMRHLHVASVRWDGTTLWQSSNDGGAGARDNAWIDRQLPLVSASRVEAFGLVFTRLGILPPHGWGIRPGTVVTVNAEDDSLDAVDVPVQGVDPAGFLQIEYGTAASSLTVARGLVTPSGPDSQRRWCPFGMATRVRGGTAGAVVVEIKRWRAGWDPEPGWDDPRVMRATVTPDSGGNVPEMALGPGLHGIWAAHFHDGSSGAWGPVTFTRLDRLDQ